MICSRCLSRVNLLIEFSIISAIYFHFVVVSFAIISHWSRIHLAIISHWSRIHLAFISHWSRIHLAKKISQSSRTHLANIWQSSASRTNLAIISHQTLVVLVIISRSHSVHNCKWEMLYFEYRTDILKLINDILTDTMSLLFRRGFNKINISSEKFRQGRFCTPHFR